VNTKSVQASGIHVWPVKQFIEKPGLTRVRKLINHKNVFWNMGWFAWRVDHLMSLYKKYLPQNFASFKRIGKAPHQKLQSTINREFPKLKSIPIDYAILEKTKDILLLSAQIEWSDIGHFRSVQEMSKKDKQGNAVRGKSVLLDSRDNLLMSESGKLITSVGVENLVMIETDDVILLIDKDRAQEVKLIIEHLKKNNMKKYL